MAKPETGVVQTPLHEVHVALGAALTDFAGWSMPLRYGSEIAEHHAVRRAAGIFDLSHMGEIEVTGSDAGAALDHALVGRPSALVPGRARYSMLCDPSGGILDDVVVYRLAPERFLVVANASNATTVHTEITARAVGHSAQVRLVSADWALIAVQGPTSPAIIAQAAAADVSGLRYYTVAPARVGGADVLLARTGYTGEDGFEVYCPAEAAVGVWVALTAAGADHGLVPAGLACRDSLRLEAGMPLYGQELSAEVTPFEVGLGRLVVFDKPGGFVGEQALTARRDQPRCILVGLAGAGRRAPRTRYRVVDPATGSRVGQVTSGLPSPTLGHPVAMALVAPDRVAIGTALQVDVRGRGEDVEVVPLPFYRRPR